MDRSRYALSCLSAAAPLLLAALMIRAATADLPPELSDVAAWPASPHLLVDQFGYPTDADKVAVLVDPVVGRNADAEYEPSTELQLVRLPSTFVGSFEPMLWNDGEVQENSGDRGWWVDFSRVTELGDYVLADTERKVTTGVFRIADDVYEPVLRDAVRTFFYQRSGFPKREPYAEAPWTDRAAYLRKGQEREARYYRTPDDASTERDLHGGWFDAGDTNKYVTFSSGPVHDLLTAYTDNRAAFTDDFGLPESGNGVPDLLDEVRWNVDWVRRMQNEDGSVLQKMGEVDYSGLTPPSADKRARFYGEACSSATICHAGMIAHAAAVWRLVPAWRSEADTLAAEAVRSWEHYHANDRSADCDDQTIKSGDADMSLEDQDQEAVVAAVWLWIATGDERFNEYVRQHWRETEALGKGGHWNWGAYSGHVADALVAYTRRRGADPVVVEAVNAQRRRATEIGLHRWDAAADLYRAPTNSFHWGGNRARAALAAAAEETARWLGDDPAAEGALRLAHAHAHYLHGVNPMGLCYLTNMSRHGAERSAMQLYHTWFRHGSRLDGNPPPGYLVGGPNRSYSGTVAWLRDEPPQKAYHEFNDGHPEASWEITENSNTYQAAYVKLLARLMR